MRLQFLFLFLSFSSVLVFGQRVVANKPMVQKALQADHNARISKVIVSKHLETPSVRCWGGATLTSDSPCIVIEYVVEKDSNGSRFRRILYIPSYLLKKAIFSEDDVCYYEDHCLGRPHFDTQGGAFPADKVTKKILSHIKMKK